jgi:biofilm protein TabA
MMKNLIILFMAIIAFSAYAQNDKIPEKWSDKEVNTWFDKQEWLNGWNVQPETSVNKRSLAIQYFKNKKHWDQAFLFLKSSDLKNLPVGKQELDGKDLFVTVSEYLSKDKEKARYESHKKYIDIQYVISGKEKMGLTTTENAEIAVPYNEEKDVAFYNFEGGNYILATPSNFFVFFPEDVHRPSIKAEENETVKKIVVKILVE